MRRLDPVFRGSCPNCGGPIQASRLEKGLPCASCLPREVHGGVEEIAEELARHGRLRGYLWLYDLEDRFREFKAFFEARTGSSLWSAQKSWARRLLALDSIAIIAPTGVGKTTLLQAYSLYRAEKEGWKILYLVPTENLARQVYSRLNKLAKHARVVAYFSSMGKKAREEALRRIEEGDYDILVVTTGFLQRRWEMLYETGGFDLVIVDDVDSLLRSSRNVDRVLLLLGYTREAVEAAEKLVRTKLKLYAALASGNEERIKKLQEAVAEAETELRMHAPTRLGQLVIASATGRPRGIKHLLFKELMGFEVGGGTDYMRNVLDTYKVVDDPSEGVEELLEKLGPGAVIFVSQLYGKAQAKLLAQKLQEKGFRVGLALAGSRRVIDKLASGEVDVVVGVASRYGVIVRGLDLPERVRYAVFVGVPARRMAYWDAVASPRRLLSILFYLSDRGEEWAREYADKIRRMLDKLTDTSIVSAAFKGRLDAEGLLADLVAVMKEAAARAEESLKMIVGSDGSVRIGGTVIEASEGALWVIIPDAPTYLQASGRTSRLYKGTMTYGLSIVLARRLDLVEALWERLAWYTSSEPVPLESLDLAREARRIDESRQGKGKKVTVKTVLLVVESPTKARTIAWFWGRPSRRRIGRLTVYETSAVDPETGVVYLLTVTATRGHMYDLATDEDESLHGVRVEGGTYQPVYTSIKKCLNCGYQYTADGPCPRCGATTVYDSKKVSETLRKLASEVDEVIIATDPDREGEKIAWDVYLMIRPYNPNIRRGRFHEVTRTAIIEALRTAGPIMDRLVEAQIVRRIEDRWIGFTLSSHLWGVFGKHWLGAGRVQTPVLGWIIDRYEEWKKERGYRVIAALENGRVFFFTREKEEAARAKEEHHITVEAAEYWESESNPPPPFTTDSLLYEASRRYGYPARLVMKLAQDLFESGLITYHRTDSTRVSPQGMGVAKAYLEKKGLSHLYKARSWGEGGAHEAIRPTRPLDAAELERAVYDGTLRVPIKLTRAHIKLYKLIFDRFVASQMKPSRLVYARVTVALGPLRETVEGPVAAVGEGYHLVYKPRLYEWARSLAPGDKLPVAEVKVVRSSRVTLYRSGDVIKIMKEKRIGRPSTYAQAIEANRRHGYIIESKRLSYLIPTKTGIEVYSYLQENFIELVSEETSRRLEEELEAIEAGERDPIEVLEGVRERIEHLVGQASGVGTAAT